MTSSRCETSTIGWPSCCGASSYAPLNAMNASVLLESIEIEFDGFEMR